MKSFLPENFSPPTQIATDAFVMVPLAPEHNAIDFDAWSTSIPELKGVFGPGNSWPENVTSLSKNLRDLEKHYAGFLARTECTYTVLTLDETRCLGCVYLRPSKTEDFDCRVDFWVRTSDRHLQPHLFTFLQKWLADSWPFRAPHFNGAATIR